ncbi:DVUA0089 family protein [Chamaesiphon minutus]|uniref:PEP-CTERM putative exosortase interaction domain-containing protein n=1 Tax=Chamaesiphon minutus (strain ATCC 27169 / PCC 6605) TaxID=1173020 RepID=K9UIN0_CHAP6|nr:DVUA0089 family protein [Chamaesiphon minutus]AFY94064.1 PEP-CTERM putative exosortase interaction domain-containing protein [Chamaesiphon minutus PCC 6605]
MNKFTIATILGITTTATLVTLVAPAYGASLTGSLANADAIASLPFNSDGSELTFRSLSYNGGTNAAGTVIPAGGFSPVLTIFTASGSYFNEYTDVEDLNFTATLLPGNYQAVISTFGRFFDSANKTNISQGFDGSGDFFGRNANYAVDIVAVPEPSSSIGIMLAGLSAFKLKRKLVAAKKAGLDRL